LNDVVIKDVIDEEEVTIYHSDYDLNLFKDVFNKYPRIKYVYSERDIDYDKKNVLGYDVAKEIESYINDFSFFTSVFVYCLSFVSIMLLFILESNRVNKHISFFKVINLNRIEIRKLLFLYSLLYLVLGIIFVFDLRLLIIYIVGYCLFFFLIKRKIKSRFPWI
jgi:hypothetical protein